MTTLEEILHGDIRKLNLAIEGLETQLKETNDKDVKLSIDAKITAKQNSVTAKTELLTALIKSQGNFSSLISMVRSQSSRCNPLPKFLSTSPLHPFSVGSLAK
jgi:hypothetical protein